MSFEKVPNDKGGYYYDPEVGMPQPDAQTEKSQYTDKIYDHLLNSAITALSNLREEVQKTGEKGPACANAMNTIASVFYKTGLSLTHTLRQIQRTSITYPEYKSYWDKMAAILRAYEDNCLKVNIFVNDQFLENKAAKPDSITISTPDESEVVSREEDILKYNFQKTKEVIERVLQRENLVDVLLESSESHIALRSPPSMWLDISAKSSREFMAKVSAVVQVLKEYQDPKGIYSGTYWFDVLESRDNTSIEIKPHPQNTLRNTLLSDDFEEKFVRDYKQRLPIEKNKENLAWLDIYIRGHLDFLVHIPVDELGVRKIQFQITGRKFNPEDKIRPEELSAVNLALKATGLNFRRDDNDPSTFSPLPGLKTTMMEKDTLDAFLKAYEKNHEFLRNAKDDLLTNRTLEEKSIDWLQDHPITTFGLSVLGFILLLVPGIILTAAYFGGKK